MLRYLSPLLIATMLLLPNTVHSKETVHVIVLPFKIHAQEDLSYMKDEIPELLKKHLKLEGATVLDADTISKFSWTDKAVNNDEFRNFGVENAADYVIWGSLTWIGQQFSLDAKMIETFGEEPPSVFFLEGESIENLLGTVKELAQSLGVKILKREKVVDILVEGNKRIEADAIKRIIKTKPGDIYLAQSLSEDLKAVYSMGYFEDVRIEAESGAEGKTIVFKVKEKATVRIIRTKGNRVFEDEEIMGSIDITRGSILNVFRINSNVKRIENLYKEKNYHNVKVSYNIHEAEQNQADLEFVIEEGEKLLIKKIIFQGNSAYSSRKLKKIMETSEKGFLSWIISSGVLNKDNLDQDAAKLAAFYHNNGFIEAKVGEPQIEYKDNWINITIKIDEGPQFKVGKVDIGGDIILTKEALLEHVKITKETFYNREVIRDDVLVLTDLYSDEGYAYADISPRINKDPENLKVDITYVAEKGNQVYFEKIIISGNTKTRDKVIRRQLKVYEHELYSGKQIKSGMRNLHRIDYFEDIKVDTAKGSSDDKMILKLNVTEKPTGTFTFGGGFSTVENAFFMAAITQRNLFGRGQILGLKAQLGSITQRFTLSFTEPWLFDIPLSAGFDLYKWDRDYYDYDKDSTGGAIRFSYPIYDYTRVYLSYYYDHADITNIDKDAAKSIKDLKGTNVASGVITSLGYDSRDKVFNPTEGQDHRIQVQYSGIGGDIAFTRLLAEAGIYIPLFKETVGFLHGAAGYVTENSGGKLPDYERFYLGGMNTVRGFDWRDLHATDDDGNEIGGDKYVQFNVEYIVPLIKKAGLVGLVFFDTGEVYGDSENIDLGNLRESAGYGFRWYSPMGPIRVECGYILDPKKGESSGGRWEFSMGAAF